MRKPSTISLQPFLIQHLRETVAENVKNSIGGVIHSVTSDTTRRYQPDSNPIVLPRFMLRPVIAGEVHLDRLDSLQVFHIEFQEFDAQQEDPQISCHMLGHVFWNANMRREPVSIKFRFNLKSQHQTNAYITYL